MKKSFRWWICLGASTALLFLIIAAIASRRSEPSWVLPALSLLASAAVYGLLVYGHRIRRRLTWETEHSKFHDQFTDLPNGLRLAEDFGLIEGKSGRVLVLIQLNRLQLLLSLFGTAISSQTLLRLCPVLIQFAEGHEGKAYRLSLDQFALLTKAGDQKRYLAELEKLFAEMEQVYVQDRHVTYSYSYTYSYAVYFLDEADKRPGSLREISELCNTALARLRDNGHSQSTVFNEQTRPDWELREQLTADLEGSWKARAFVPWYQIVFNLETGKPVGAELLTRWQHPARGLLLPADFLPVMESEGYIMDLDLYMLEEACKRIKKWIDEELVTVPLSINLSRLNIHRQDFVERVIATVLEYDIPPILIELELTESILLYEKNDAFLALTKRLHEFGFTLTIDNFGSGEFPGISLLRDLPIDVIKVSPAFFEHIHDSKRDRAFILNVLRLAKELGIQVVALGVETKQQSNLYKQLGCACAQGFFLSRPMSTEDFEKQIF